MFFIIALDCRGLAIKEIIPQNLMLLPSAAFLKKQHTIGKPLFTFVLQTNNSVFKISNIFNLDIKKTYYFISVINTAFSITFSCLKQMYY